jgi:site-specific recombinase
MHSLHPLKSGLIWYAALTGVILWSSSLVGGWIENFAVYRRLPQAIAEHRTWQGDRAPVHALVQRRLRPYVSGWSSSLALGLMLGDDPVLGKFFGLPLDVRHVTLSSGRLALALSGQAAPP